MIYGNLYKANGKSYVAISKKRVDSSNKPIKKDEAIRIANKHFKTKLGALEVVSGKVEKDGTLRIGVRGDWWVVYRR